MAAPLLGGRVPVAKDRRALQPYLTTQRKFDAELRRILNSSLRSIDADIRRLTAKNGIGAAVRVAQLRLIRAAIYNQLRDLWNKTESTILNGRGEAGIAAAESAFIYSEGLLEAAGLEGKAAILRRAEETYAKRTVDNVAARLLYSKQELAKSVYKNQALSRGLVDKAISDTLAKGGSARYLADLVKGFINPNVPGGISSAAMRLGRTELNNAFHAVQAKLNDDEPWVTGSRWNLSSSHPAPDECDRYAGDVHQVGGEAGVFDKDSVPRKPHPQCLCFITPVLIPEDEFDDDILNQFLSDIGRK